MYPPGPSISSTKDSESSAQSSPPPTISAVLPFSRMARIPAPSRRGMRAQEPAVVTSHSKAPANTVASPVAALPRAHA
ncbi:hypothetical protein [Streptomyces sp. NPDC092370]|uniref:hypothetical protein n=1 Tax=Streptomyces sp. NPDC092370 TaxID=3366016 RepID=UPI00382FDA1B